MSEIYDRLLYLAEKRKSTATIEGKWPDDLLSATSALFRNTISDLIICINTSWPSEWHLFHNFLTVGNAWRTLPELQKLFDAEKVHYILEQRWTDNLDYFILSDGRRCMWKDEEDTLWDQFSVTMNNIDKYQELLKCTLPDYK